MNRIAKIAFFEIENHEKKVVAEQFKDTDNEIIFYEENIIEENYNEFIDLIEDVDIISVFVHSKLTKKILSKLSSLKFIATRSTGFDHIDLKYCNDNNIIISNVPSYGERTVAEYTLALMITLSRKIHISYERTLKGDFSNEGLTGIDLFGKTLGVIGTGKIGQNVIKIADGFGMKVIAFDAYPNKELAKKLHFEYKKLDEIFTTSNVLTFHVPYLESTHHLLNMENIKTLKKGVIIINTSRGPVTQSKALLYGIENNIIQAIGLDTVEEEDCTFTNTCNERKCDQRGTDYLRTIVDNNILLRKENVIMTPHNAFNSKEALRRILDTSITNVLNFIDNKTENIVKTN